MKTSLSRPRQYDANADSSFTSQSFPSTVTIPSKEDFGASVRGGRTTHLNLNPFESRVSAPPDQSRSPAVCLARKPLVGPPLAIWISAPTLRGLVSLQRCRLAPPLLTGFTKVFSSPSPPHLVSLYSLVWFPSTWKHALVDVCLQVIVLIIREIKISGEF